MPRSRKPNSKVSHTRLGHNVSVRVEVVVAVAVGVGVEVGVTATCHRFGPTRLSVRTSTNLCAGQEEERLNQDPVTSSPYHHSLPQWR